MNNLFKYILFAFASCLSFTSCSDSESSEEADSSALDNMEYKAEKIKLKVQYREDNSERFKEEWTYNDKKKLISYSSYEDGSLIEKYSDFNYTKSNGNFVQEYKRCYYMVGYSIPYVTETIVNTYKDSTCTILLKEEVNGKSDNTKTEYTYNEVGLLVGVEITYNGKLSRTQSDYVYEDKKCTFIEGYYSNTGSWITKKHEIEYANKSYTLVSINTIYKENHSDIEDERTYYKYNSLGQLSSVESYYFVKDNSDKWNDVYNETLSYRLKDYVYTNNGVTYTKEDFIQEESNKVEETYLE